MAAVNPGQPPQVTSNSPSRPAQSQAGNGNTGGNQGGNGNAGNGNQNGNGAQAGNNGGVNTPNTPANTPNTPANIPNTPANTPAQTTSRFTPPAATQVQAGNPGTSSNSPANNNPFTMSTSSLRPSSSAISSSSSIPSSSSSSAPPSSSSSSRPASSSVASSSTTLSSASSSATAFGNAAPASSTKTMKGSTIGAIVGGVVGGLVLLVLLWMCRRRWKERKNRVPPPPPRDMAYTSQSIARHRASMNGMRPGIDGGGASVHRASSYSTLLNARPSSMYHSRQPSVSGYYSSYPIATPSSGSHEPTTSPFMHASAGPVYSTSAEPSPPLNPDQSTAVSTDPNALGKIQGAPSDDGITPLRRPNLIPLDTGGYREGSSSSVSGSSSGRSSKPKHKNSIDRLRHESSLPNIAGVGAGGSGVTATNSRAPSPSLPSEGEPSSRATSPNPSTYATSQAHSSTSYGIQPRQYISSSLSPHPRPYSTVSMSTMGPVNISGAPHQGRRMMLQMPELLSPTSPRAESMSEFGGELRGRRSLDMLNQGQVTRDHRMSTMSDFGPASPTSTLGRHQRLPSGQSSRYSTARSQTNYDQTEEVV